MYVSGFWIGTFTFFRWIWGKLGESFEPGKLHLWSNPGVNFLVTGPWCLENCNLEVLWYIRSISCLNAYDIGIRKTLYMTVLQPHIGLNSGSMWCELLLATQCWILASNAMLKVGQGSFWEIFHDCKLQAVTQTVKGWQLALVACPKALNFGSRWSWGYVRYDGLFWKLFFQALRVQQASTATPRVGFIVWIRRLLRSEVYQFFSLYGTVHYIHYTILYCTTLHCITLHCITTYIRNISSVSNNLMTIHQLMWISVVSLPSFHRFFWVIWGVLIFGSFQMTFGDCFAYQWIIVASAATHGPQ